MALEKKKEVKLKWPENEDEEEEKEEEEEEKEEEEHEEDTGIQVQIHLTLAMVAEDEREKKRLARENEALRAQIQRMKIAAETPVRSERDEKIITNLRRKVHDYGFDLTKAERDLLNAQAKLAKSAEEHARLAHKLKQKYDKEVAILQKKLVALENEMVKQIKDFKTERNHCYALIYQLQESLQQLQDQNNTDTQVLEARAQQIGRLLQEKGVIRMRIKEIADYVVMKCHECEDMTKSMFFASLMTFVRQEMVDLDHL
ncbi:uncharacterized protein [Nicotiana tomentosiformis]|uniref:uncharacterized protein n=1 Tax=Nicotiana tomentosiformis TaxID=4098 RepID=UPI00388C5230